MHALLTIEPRLNRSKKLDWRDFCIGSQLYIDIGCAEEAKRDTMVILSHAPTGENAYVVKTTAVALCAADLTPPFWEFSKRADDLPRKVAPSLLAVGVHLFSRPIWHSHNSTFAYGLQL